MKRIFTFAMFAISVATTTMLMGCKGEATTDATPDATAAPDSTDGAAAATDEEDVLASFTAAEKAAILAQKICPVTDEDLGSMGPPIKVAVSGKDVYVCCDACIEELKGDPDKYLAKLDKGAAGEEADAADAATDTAPGADAASADGAGN